MLAALWVHCSNLVQACAFAFHVLGESSTTVTTTLVSETVVGVGLLKNSMLVLILVLVRVCYPKKHTVNPKARSSDYSYEFKLHITQGILVIIMLLVKRR